MRYSSIARCSVVLIATLATGAVPLQAQLHAVRPDLAKHPAIPARVYTPSELRARFQSLANGAALAAMVNGGGAAGTTQVHAIPAASGSSASGIGTVGGATTLTQANTATDQDQWHAELSAFHTDFVGGTVNLVPGGWATVAITAPPGRSGPFTFLVLFDLAPPYGPLNTSLTIATSDGRTSNCTAAQLRANLSGGVTSCAESVSAEPGQGSAEVRLTFPATENSRFQLVDVAILRVR